MTDPRDSALETLRVLRAQTGEIEAFDELFRAIQGPLSGYLLGLIGDRGLAEEVLQDVFLRIYRKLRWLRNPNLFRPWSYRIASREAFRRIARERRRPESARDGDLEALSAPVREEAFSPDLVAQIPRLVERIPPASRAVLLLHYLQEIPLDEIADVLGIPPGTVRSRLAYGLQCLRRELRVEEGRDPGRLPQSHR
jgi:RNA polymerase sigma-70 factor, ECF subfamily